MLKNIIQYFWSSAYTFATVQKAAACILIIVFVGQAFNQNLYYLDYVLKKAEYTNKCVNKSRPWMHCNGKCQMMKKLEEQEKKEHGQPPELRCASNCEVLPTEQYIFEPYYCKLNNIHFPLFHQGYPIDRTAAIFHPPRGNSHHLI